MAAPTLEIAVLVLGLIVLMFEAFLKQIDKRRHLVCRACAAG